MNNEHSKNNDNEADNIYYGGVTSQHYYQNKNRTTKFMLLESHLSNRTCEQKSLLDKNYSHIFSEEIKLFSAFMLV